MIALLLLLAVGLAGCGNLVAPHQTTTSDTVHSAGVEKDMFEAAWEKLKDVLVATAVASALSEFRELIGDLKGSLDAIDATTLNQDELEFRARFYGVYQAYADSVALWEVDARSTDIKCDGIPIFRGETPLVPRAREIMTQYGLKVTVSPDSDVKCVPDQSIATLWDYARSRTEEWLLPVMVR